MDLVPDAIGRRPRPPSLITRALDGPVSGRLRQELMPD